MEIDFVSFVVGPDCGLSKSRPKFVAPPPPRSVVIASRFFRQTSRFLGKIPLTHSRDCEVMMKELTMTLTCNWGDERLGTNEDATHVMKCLSLQNVAASFTDILVT